MKKYGALIVIGLLFIAYLMAAIQNLNAEPEKEGIRNTGLIDSLAERGIIFWTDEPLDINELEEGIIYDEAMLIADPNSVFPSLIIYGFQNGTRKHIMRLEVDL